MKVPLQHANEDNWGSARRCPGASAQPLAARLRSVRRLRIRLKKSPFAVTIYVY
jgi:hypothetical protein